jgi:DNA (cytosine-5)-methyltransferase 3A
MGINVLSLFDGMSCGQQALERAGIEVDNYFASEIDKYAMQVTMANYPNTKQLGSVVNVNGYDLPKIDLLIGGSPCQSFSFAGKRKGMATKCETEILTLDHYLELKSDGYEFEGQSYLFWEFMRLLNECKPKYFLLENVEMGEKWEKVLSKAIGVNGIHINSALVSAQNRKRIYWTNIGMQPGGLFGDLVSIIQKPKDKGILLKDVLQDNPNPKYYISTKMEEHLSSRENVKIKNGEEKSGTITTNGEGKQGNNSTFICQEVDEKYFLSDNTINRILKSDFGKEFRNPLTDKSTPLLMNYYKQGNDGNYIKIDKKGNIKTNQDKASCFSAGGHSGGNHSDMDLIVHNTMPRSGDPKKGGTGHLTKTDGKTYCLDTGNTNAVEIKSIMLGRSESWGAPEKGDGKHFILCKGEAHGIKYNNTIRRLTPLECERLQTVADNYTNHVSDSQRYKMLGNGWTVDVIAHIFKYL